MNLRRKIKFDARRALGGGWPKAICLVLLSLGITTLFSVLEELFILITHTTNYWSLLTAAQITPQMLISLSEGPLLISALLIFLSVFISAPLNLGAARWYYNRTQGEYGPVSDVFHFFSQGRLLWRSIWYAVQLFVRSFLWGLVFFVPGTAVGTVTLVSILRAGDQLDLLWGSLGVLCTFLLLLAGGLLYSICIQRYFLSAFYLARNPELPARRAICQSVAATRYHRGDLFVFEFSFIGWKLLGILILPQLYTMPYLLQSQAIYARFLMEAYENPAVTMEVPAPDAQVTREFCAPGEPGDQPQPTQQQ